MLKIAITGLLFFAVCPVAAQEVPTTPTNKIVLGGERVRVGYSFEVNPDCRVRGEVKSRMLEQPKNGVVETVTERGFTAYPKEDPRHKCNEKEIDVQAYYYKSREDFKGKDRFVIEVFFPTGSYRKRIFNMDVR